MCYNDVIKEREVLKMATVSTSLRLDLKLHEWLKEYADFHGNTVTSVITEILSEKMQDDLDYVEAIESLNDSVGKKNISREEMLRKYGGI